MKKLLSRLIPATNATALAAAIAHVISLAVMSGGVGFESIYIAFITYIIAFVIALPVGAALLFLVGHFRLGLISSLILFLLVIQAIVVAIVMLLFESELSQVPLQYGLISIPATLAAWYFSVYIVSKSASSNT